MRTLHLLSPTKKPLPRILFLYFNIPHLRTTAWNWTDSPALSTQNTVKLKGSAADNRKMIDLLFDGHTKRGDKKRETALNINGWMYWQARKDLVSPSSWRSGIRSRASARQAASTSGGRRKSRFFGHFTSLFGKIIVIGWTSATIEQGDWDYDDEDYETMTRSSFGSRRKRV